MTDELGRTLGVLLRAAGVPERDPFFRIGVLERRARETFLRRRRKLLVVAAVVATLHVLFLALAWVTGALDAALILLFAAGLLAATFLSARGVMQAWRWLRDS